MLLIPNILEKIHIEKQSVPERMRAHDWGNAERWKRYGTLAIFALGLSGWLGDGLRHKTYLDEGVD